MTYQPTRRAALVWRLAATAAAALTAVAVAGIPARASTNTSTQTTGGGTAVALSGDGTTASGSTSSNGITSTYPGTGGANACGVRNARPYLASFADPTGYFPATGGTFEDGAPTWHLANAHVAVANEPWHVVGAGSSALAIGPGGSAQTGFDCNTAGENALRFFYKAPAVAGSQLSVTVETFGAGGVLTSQTTLLPGSRVGWTLSPSIAISNGRLLSLQFVRLTFTASTAAGWQIDDVLVDPWRTL